MPRQIDLFPQNLQVNNDPTNRLGVTAAQVNHLNDQIPAALAKAQSLAITNFLTLLDQETGLDLLGWWKDTQLLLNWTSASLQQSWLGFQQLIQGVTQETDADVVALVNYLNGISADVTQSSQAFATLLESWYTDLTTTGQPLSTTLTAMESDWATYVAANQQIGSSAYATLTQMLDSVFGIDPTTGLTGQAQVAGLQDSFNQLGAAVNGDVANAGSWTWLAELVYSSQTLLGLAHTKSVDNANTLAIRNNQDIFKGLDDTTESNMGYLDAVTPITLLAPNSVMAFVRVGQESTKNTAAFTGDRPATVPSGLNVNIWRLDFANSLLDYITTTTFTSSQLNFTAETMLFASAGATVVNPGDVLAIEWQSTDTSNAFTLYGQATSKPAHPIAQLPAFGATRAAGTTTPSGTVAFSALTFTNANIPYVGLEISSPPPPVYPDYTTPFTSSGTYTALSWSAHIDLIGVGMGGGGQGETGSTVGRGGSPGSWNGQTLAAGTDYSPGTTVFTVTVGMPGTSGTSNPGAGGAYFADGQDGSSVTVTWTDPSSAPRTFTATGGLGGGIHNGSNLTTYGQSPGDYTYHTVVYSGGLAAIVPEAGNPPGGSGPGGQPFQYGWQGARGQAWIVERQS